MARPDRGPQPALEVSESRLIAAPGIAHPGPLEVTTLYHRPEGARAILALGHGAGSHCRHALVENLALALSDAGIATLRFNYPYSERGGGMSSLPVRLATVRSAAAEAQRLAGGLPLFVGGHSMSGRMFTTALSEQPLAEVRGAVVFAFPLHSGAPDRARAAHLANVRCPLLFLSGDRDKMAEGALLAQVIGELPRARLRVIEAADHGFGALKRRGNPQPVHGELARHVREWMDDVLSAP